MSDLVESLRELARKRCERHNAVDQFDPSWEKKPKDFLEWQAADEIERLRKGWESLEWESTQRIAELEGAIDVVTDSSCYNEDKKEWTVSDEAFSKLDRLRWVKPKEQTDD